MDSGRNDMGLRARLSMLIAVRVVVGTLLLGWAILLCKDKAQQQLSGMITVFGCECQTLDVIGD